MNGGVPIYDEVLQTEESIRITLPKDIAGNLFDFLGNISAFDVRCILEGHQPYVSKEIVTKMHDSNYYVWKALQKALIMEEIRQTK